MPAIIRLPVGATASSDARASYSNFGTCVDIFAPGSSITSAWNTGIGATNTISGTSMASPHVTGAAALAAQANPAASPAGIAAFLVSHATPDHVTSPGAGSPNLLLYSLGGGAATEPSTQVVAVSGLSTTAALSGNGARPKNWQAQATVTVRNVNSGANVANATVSGSFTPGKSGSCVTGSTGSCTLGSGNLSITADMVTVFTVTGISGSNMSYDASQNRAVRETISSPAQ